MDIQKLLDVTSKASRNTRADYHLTLGTAIATLEQIAPDTRVMLPSGLGVGKVRSYRGYYSDLAFPLEPSRTFAKDVLADLKAALGATFEGYKGGDFVMDADTPLWLSEWGACSGDAVTGLMVNEQGIAVLHIRNVD